VRSTVAQAGGHAARALVALAVILVASVANGQSLRLTLDPTYTNSQSVQTDQLGRETQIDAQALIQRYMVAFNQAIFPQLTLTANGQLDWALGWTWTNGIPANLSRLLWNLNAAAQVGGPVLSGTAGYALRETLGSGSQGGLSFSEPTLVAQNIIASFLWRPDETGMIQAQYVNSHNYDTARSLIDRYGNDLYATAQWTPIRPLTLRYSFTFSTNQSVIAGVDQQAIQNSGFASFGERFLDGFLTVNAVYQIDLRNVTTSVTRPGAIIETQRFPIQGLSLVETPPATPERDTLAPNPALIDGNTQLSAGIDLGFGVTDQQFRDVGARFADTLSRVNAVYVWVDRALPPEISGAFTWLAYASEDNLTWTPLQVTGRPGFSSFFNRFEIPITAVQARYVKVATRPLLPGVTTDPRYASLFVTEIQLFELVEGTSVPRSLATANGSLSGAVVMRLVESLNFNYEFTAGLTHNSTAGLATYSIGNALSLATGLTRGLSLSARLQRTDFGGQAQPTGSTNYWSTTLAYDPFPTLGIAATYFGSVSEGSYVPIIGQPAVTGTRVNNLFQLSMRMDLYQGVSLFANASYGILLGANGADSISLSGTFGATVAFNRVVSLTASVLGSDVRGSLTGGTSQYARVDTTVTVTPFPALYVTAGYGHYTVGLGPADVLLVNASFSPFPNNDLQLRFGYSDNLDTGLDLRSRLWGPGLRWNIRRGSWLDVNYSIHDNYTATLTSHARVFFANLFITIG
jgi:hypothetical protein